MLQALSVSQSSKSKASFVYVDDGMDWFAFNLKRNAGVLEFNVTPDPIVMLPDPELVVISPTFKYLGAWI